MSNLEDYFKSPEEITFERNRKNRIGCIMNINKVVGGKDFPDGLNPTIFSEDYL